MDAAERTLRETIALAAERMNAAREGLDPPARPMLDHLVASIRAAGRGAWLEPRRRMVNRHLPGLLDAAARRDAALAARLARLTDGLHWTQTYSDGPVPDAFFENYGHAALVGPAAPARSERVKLGLIVMGPGQHYPDHAHPAGEFYFLLAGQPRWRIGSGAWHRRGPGALIHHAPEEAHATESCETGLLALYAWYGAIHTPPHFVGHGPAGEGGQSEGER
jgi:quercetin dioxygenase-like cupin family protein